MSRIEGCGLSVPHIHSASPGPGGAEPAGLLEQLLGHPMLPTPPALALRVVELASQPECNPKEICRLLSGDPALCAQLLKTVNSPLFGISRPANSIDRAVAMLGAKGLRSLVLGFSLAAMQRGMGADKRLERFWQEAAAGAIFARELAALRPPLGPQEEMVAALLRDIGRLVLHQVMPTHYAVLSEKAKIGPQRELCDLERERFQFDHADLGAGLLERWRLPADLVSLVRYHHRPEALPAEQIALRRRVHLLQLADDLARLDEISLSPRRLEKLLKRAQEEFALSKDELLDFVQKSAPRIEEFSALFRIDLASRPDFGMILARGCEELVRLSMEPSAEPQLEEGLEQEAPDRTILVRKNTRKSAITSVGDTHSGGRTQADIRTDDPTQWDLPPYEVREVLGRGAMGVVLKAFDPGLERMVAIKVLAPERAHCADARKRFAREARTAASIRHSHVVTIHSVQEQHVPPYLVMEFVPGVSLQQKLDRHGPLPLDRLIRVGRQIASGLAAAHQMKLIHRDIKPANILLDDQTQDVKITDFGLARSVDDVRMSLDGQLIGTPLYMSPEQVQGERIDPRSDLFSLGSVLFTLSTGAPPFPGQSMASVLHQVVNRPSPSVLEYSPHLPIWYAELVSMLQAKHPADRIQTAEEVAAILYERER